MVKADFLPTAPVAKNPAPVPAPTNPAPTPSSIDVKTLPTRSDTSATSFQQSATIKDMQQAIINLSYTFANVFSADHQNSFVSYLFSRSHHTSDPKIFEKVLNNMSQIGSGKELARPDGIWGPKTNAALSDVVKILTQLVKLQQELEIPADDFNNEVIEISSVLSLTDLSKEKKAEQITAHLHKIENFMQQFEKSVIAPHAQYLTGQKELVDLNARSILSPKEEDYFTKWQDYPIAKMKGITFTLKDLKDMQDFKKVALEAGFNPNDGQQMKGLLEYLRKQAPQAIKGLKGY